MQSLALDRTFFLELTTIPEPSPLQIGGKGVGLIELYALGLEMPPTWVLQAGAFDALISRLNLLPQLEQLEQLIGSKPPGEKLEAIRQTILSTPLPNDLLEQIHDLRSQWAERFGGRIIVRSSATVEDSKHHSFAGIFESISCQSDQEVEDAIRTVWASVFSPRAFAYYNVASLKRFPAMALLLQPFVEADRSGVMFTSFAGADRIPQILVEHVEGDCEKLVKGQVNPDRFWLKRWPKDGNDLPDSTGELRPNFAFELATIAQKLESKLQQPQDVEWCVRDEKLYLLQTRPITTGNDGASASQSGDILLQGLGASPGHGTGTVHLVFNIEDADVLTTGQVLTTTMTNPDMVPTMQRSAAIVTDVGGMICHAAIVSRELGVPCVVGTGAATQLLQPGSLVTVDGSNGIIFKGLVEFQKAASPVRELRWSDLWREWQAGITVNAVPLLSTCQALADMPQEIGRCVLDPFCDLNLDALADIFPLDALSEVSKDRLLRSYIERLSIAIDQTGLKSIFLALHRLDSDTRQQFTQFLKPELPILPLEHQSDHGLWQIYIAPGGQSFALLDKLTPEMNLTAPQNTIMAIPLGFGRLLGSDSVQFPDPSKQDASGMFGMKPAVQMATMPAQQRREALHRLIPTLSAAHGGKIPTSEMLFPWLDVRPEVPITPFLKAFVTPAVEAIPFVMGFDDLPLHVQFIRCRFHFRQDTLMGFFPKLMQATWDERFLSDMLKRCRDSYLDLEALSESLPVGERELAHVSNEELRERFLAWWLAFCNFFSLSFFIQAQGDDCIFPALGKMLNANSALLGDSQSDWQIPGLAELSAPVTPVLTAEYMKDLLGLKEALSVQGIADLSTAEAAIRSEDYPALNALFEHFRESWHWMRERDPYYDPYDTPKAILEKALAVQSVAASDYEKNHYHAVLALALHFDLARLTDSSEKIVYAMKYGRALAIDRENHHIVWLRASYRLRKLLLEWERRLREHSHLEHRDIFFMQPWEILDAVANLPEPIPAQLLGDIRNRRLAYEQEIQLKAGKNPRLTPQREEDYY